MAEKNEKNQYNVSGKYYVDSQCIDCGLCMSIAPDFMHHDDSGCAFVAKQPESQEDADTINEALDSCPVQAIGDDGE